MTDWWGLLDVDGARRGGVHRHLEAAEVVRGTLLLAQLEHSDEHRWHPLAVRRAVLLDVAQGRHRVETAI